MAKSYSFFNLKLVLILTLLIGVLFAQPLFSYDDDDDWRKEEATDTRFPYLKDTYEDTLNLPFEDVWDAAVKCIDEINCQIITKNPRQADDGLYRGTIQSDYCVFALGDTTLKNLKYYSIEVPFIRGGNWVNARFQYKFIIKELEDGNCSVRLIGEVSGMEDHVTNKVHFWKSNGFKEYQMLERLKKNLGLPNDFKENL